MSQQLAQVIEVEAGPVKAKVDTGIWAVDVLITVIFVVAFVWLLKLFRKPPGP